VYGGPVRSISSLYEAIARLGTQVTLLTTDANSSGRVDVPLRRPVEVEGVTVWYFPCLMKDSFFYSPELAQAFKSVVGQYDLAVLEGLWAHAMGPAVAACRRFRVPYVIPLRGQLLPWSLRQKRLKKLLYLALFGQRYLNNAAALHCTDQVEAEAAAAFGFGTPLFVVPNGVDISRFKNLPVKGTLRRLRGITPESVVLLFVGRLHRKKRPDIAVESLAAVASSGREVHLLLAGSDDEGLAPRIQAQAQKLGYNQAIHLLGLMQGEEILQAYADADLLLMPSEPESENFGMAAVEAMAAGLPILVSDGVPVGRWAEAAGAGRMVPCSAEAFAEAVRDLLAKPELLKSMGQKSRTLVRERFDIGVVASQMLEQFQAIITMGNPLPE